MGKVIPGRRNGTGKSMEKRKNISEARVLVWWLGPFVAKPIGKGVYK